MRYIGGVVTLAALVFPMIVLYKLWSTRRDSNINNGNKINQRDPSSSSVVTSYVMFDSEESQDNDDDIIPEPVESSSSMFDYEDSNDNIHIAITQQPPRTTSPSTSHFQSSNSNIDITPQQDSPASPTTSPDISPSEDSKNSNNKITQQLESTSDLATPPAMSHSADLSYSTSLPSVEYEVFLSFRGPDTRYQITEILFRFLIHSKIHTFKDDDEMRKGEGIWPTLVKAINQSKVYVPILSENYAHSKWCLNELVEIVKCWKQDRRRIILPIFYMVDPRDVRHQSGPYEEAFKNHEKMFDQSDIETWRNALKEIGTLKGWHVKDNNEQVAISDDVSEVIWSHVIKSNVSLDDAVELVGIDDHVNAIVDSLSLDSDESTVMVGIHGTGGIGKTTLATAVYNKISARFDRCSFLENIRETQQHKDGILTLQKKLISNILRKDFVVLNDVHEGRKMLRERASQFKVLVVLDDVDDSFKFDDILGHAGNFLPGSRFIATSRDVRVLRSLNREKCKLYEVKYMDPRRSLQLFCKHAFRKDSPPQEFDALSQDIVSTTGGLPLTLKVVGSLLYMEDVNVWKEKLAQLKETTEEEVIERLKISYNALEHEAKQIFLDIACFYIGSDKQIVSYMWEDCNFRPVINIKILIQRSMIKIDDDNKFQMHDQLRDMGRGIVRNENVEIPWKRSRIWSEPVIAEMLISNKKGANQVKGIKLINSSSSIRHIKSEGVVDMSEMRYLEASNVQLNGDFSNLLPNLRWLSLPNHTNDDARQGRLANLCMKNLVILDLRNSEDLRERWDGWHHIKEASKLKVLDLSNCKKLKELPRFPESGSIEILNLTDFGRSPGGELNIGKLRNLQVLKMSRGRIRKIKGGTIGMLSRLRELDVSYCRCENLGQVLVNIEKLTCLKILRAAGSGKHALAGKHLPAGLKELSTCSQVPNLSDMSELETLIVEDCREGLDIPQIDDKKLTKLHLLKLINTKINRFPTSVSNLSRLQIFNCEELEWLPSLGNLENLRELDIRGCPNLREIQGLGGLKSLTSLRMSGSRSLTHLDLASLLSFNKLKGLIISQCPLLASVKFSDRCEKDLGAVVDSLEALAIHDCTSLELAGKVMPHMCKFPKLTALTLGGFVDCEVLTLPACLEELAVLELSNLRSTQVIHCSSKLQKLTTLVIWMMRSLREIEGLSECKSLKNIIIIGCSSLEKFQVSGLEELEALTITGGCRALERFPSLANLPNLRELSLERIANLREMGNDDDIADLKCLEVLGLSGCKALERLPLGQLCGLEKLRVLNIQGCPKLSVEDVKNSLPNVQEIIADDMVSWILTNSLYWILDLGEKFELDASPSLVLDDSRWGRETESISN